MGGFILSETPVIGGSFSDCYTFSLLYFAIIQLTFFKLSARNRVDFYRQPPS
jgi:hypothetical protein